jgi:hypothetical protein
MGAQRGAYAALFALPEAALAGGLVGLLDPTQRVGTRNAMEDEDRPAEHGRRE